MQQNSTFDCESLKAISVKNGFTVKESGSYFVKPFTHQQMQDMLDHGIVNDNILEGLYKMEKYLPDYGSEIFVQLQRQDFE